MSKEQATEVTKLIKPPEPKKMTPFELYVQS
jgi:hypothetical protein